VIETKKVIAILIVAAFVLTAVPIASAGSQMWYLSSKPKPTPVMYKGSPTSDPGGCSAVTVPQQEYIIWIANEAATCDVTFHDGGWDVHLEAQRPTSDNIFIAEIGEWDGANFIFEGQYTGSFPGTGQPNTVDFRISASQFTVDEGNWLAFKLTNLEPKPRGSELGIDPCECGVSSPPSSPDYPVPELSTLILLSAGLLALAGYVLRRRKKK